MNYEDLKLIYVSKVGEIYGKTDIYEFIFSDDSENAIGFGWEQICLHNVEPPHEEYRTLIATLKTDKELSTTDKDKKMVLSLLEEQNEFRYLDGVFGFIGLAWEYIEDYQMLDSLNEERIVFHFGESFTSVERKLRLKKLTLEH
jgi:hypothetical protein